MIHEAGPFDYATGWQFCTRCGEAIKSPETITRERWVWSAAKRIEELAGTYTVTEPGVRGWPAGALVEVSRFGQCMVLELTAAPTCAATATEAA